MATKLLEMKGITRTPGISSGAPCVAGTGIQARILAGRFSAGESVADLCDDYGLLPEQVEMAIRFELARARKRMA